jgi:ABC-type amino acid transport system permease subunit
VIVRNAGTATQDIEILTREPQRLIVGEYYLFDARGKFIRPVGLSEGHVGQQFAASMYRLHFGNFAGLAMKLAYFVFGIALTVVSATGVSIWLMKRRRRGLGLPRLEQMWAAVVWGSPLLLALAFCGKLVGAREATMTAFFWVGLALSLIASTFTRLGAATLGRALRIVLAATLLLIGIGHASLADWSRAGILSIDAGLILTAAALAIVDVGVTRLGSGLRNRPGSASGSSLPTEKAA